MNMTSLLREVDTMYTLEDLEDIRLTAPTEAVELIDKLLRGEMTFPDFKEAANLILRRRQR